MIALFVVASLLAGQAASDQVFIDVTSGEIDGIAALGLWPTQGLGGMEPMDPAGCEVHLVPSSTLDEELVYPCGEWFLPPADKYKYWLEGNGWISPSSAVLRFSPMPFGGKGMAMVRTVVSAGRIALVPDHELPAGVVLRLLHTESHNRGVAPKPEMSRRLAGDRARSSVWMPEGKVLGALFDNEKGEYLALSRPTDVYHGSVSHLTFEPPGRTTDLLVVLERPEMVGTFEEYDVQARLAGLGDKPRRPDVTVPTPERFYAIWYDLEGRQARLEVESPSVYLEPADLVLRAGKVESFVGALKTLPTLTALFDLPEEISSGVLSLSLLSLPEKREIHRVDLPRHTSEHRFEKLPARQLEVALEAPPWRWVEQVDLGNGESREVIFQPEPIRIAGTVYRGEVGHPALVTFDLNRGEPFSISVETNDTGLYSIVLYRKGYYVAEIQLEGDDALSYRRYLKEPIFEDLTLDFHVPANRYRVAVVDADTGEAVRDALVRVVNRELDASGEERRMQMRKLSTDSSGRAALPAMEPGDLRLTAEAEGYWPSEEVVEKVPEQAVERELTIALARIGTTISLRLLLPGDSPAAGTEVMVLRSLENEIPLWSGRSGVEGEVRLPRETAGAWLLARHPGAAFLARPLPPPELADKGLTWRLPVAAEPLAVLLKRPWGDSAAWARLALWVSGIRLEGATLGWLTSSLPTDGGGLWRAQRLPAADLELLAWDPSELLPAPLEQLRSLAAEIQHPWPGVVEVETVN